MTSEEGPAFAVPSVNPYWSVFTPRIRSVQCDSVVNPLASHRGTAAAAVPTCGGLLPHPSINARSWAAIGRVTDPFTRFFLPVLKLWAPRTVDGVLSNSGRGAYLFQKLIIVSTT